MQMGLGIRSGFWGTFAYSQRALRLTSHKTFFSNARCLFPTHSYMTKQPDINHAMRSILVDWMVEVSSELELLSETLYIAVNLTDRFLLELFPA